MTSMFRRFLRPTPTEIVPPEDAAAFDALPAEAAVGETATVRRIVARLEAMPAARLCITCASRRR